MLETPHVAVGAAIALKVVNPALAIPLSFFSHFALERVPHWNPHLNTEIKKFGKVSNNSYKIVVADSTTALVFGLLVASSVMPDITHALTIIMSCFAAVLPDVMEAPYFFFNTKTKFIEKWINFQKSIQVDAKIRLGLLTQLITIIIALFVILS